jgi:hypothetical protein
LKVSLQNGPREREACAYQKSKEGTGKSQVDENLGIPKTHKALRPAEKAKSRGVEFFFSAESLAILKKRGMQDAGELVESLE